MKSNEFDFKDINHFRFSDINKAYKLSKEISSFFRLALLNVILIFSSPLYAQYLDIEFEHISTEQGLSEGSIYAILQDDKGFLWFGTKDGLNKYDGYNFVYYKSNPSDSTSLSDNHVYSIIQDSRGIMWIGTFSGLNKFDHFKEKFTRFLHDPNDPNSLSENRVRTLYEDNEGLIWIGTDDGLNSFNPSDSKYPENNSPQFFHYYPEPGNENSLGDKKIVCIYEDRSENLWIGTKNGGLNIFDRQNKKFRNLKHDPLNPTSLSSNEIVTIYEDNSGTLWVGTGNGLNEAVISQDKGDISGIKFIRYKSDPENPNSLSSNDIRSILEDQSGFLWIGTKGGGINILERNKKRFSHFENDPKKANSLSDNRIQPIYEDRSGLIWVGTKGGGLNKINLNKEKFEQFRNDPENSNSLSENQVYAMYEDKEGMIWIGTEGGLNKFDMSENTVTHFSHDKDKLNSLSNDRIWAICEGKNNKLWLGFKAGGLNCLDTKTGLITRYHPDENDPTSLSDDIAVSLLVDNSGALWVGTYNGLDKLEFGEENFIHYRFDPDNPKSLSNERVISLHEDNEGTLWVGTYIGLNKFDRDSGNFIRYFNDPSNPKSLSDNRIWSIYEDESGNLWLGTNGGINKFDKTTEQFIHYSEEDGLPNNVVYGILNDEDGNLWLSTNKGISKFNPVTENFINYDVKDGLQGNEFNPGAYLKTREGKLYFGGKNGFNSFHPQHINNNPHIPPVVLTAFKKFNSTVKLDTTISEANSLKLSYNENYFAFEFAALDYTFPEKNQYAYKLDGFDKDWIMSGNRRYASYTNLDGGEYVFMVKGSNNDGVWNDKGRSLKIYISPPFWQTWWFKIVSVVFTLAVLFSIYKYRINRMRKQQEQLEILVDQKTEELKGKYKESENIMRNVEEGLFILNDKHEIGNQYSKAFEQIIEESELSQKKLTDILDGKISNDQESSINRYLNLMIENNVDEETLRDLNPLEKIELNFVDKGNVWTHSKFLDFKFRRIPSSNEHQIDLFATVSDITDQVKLTEKLERTEKQSKKQMELLLSLLHVEPELLQEFITSAEKELDYVESEIKHQKKNVKYPEVLKRIYRSMHLIKGNASLLDLKFFVNGAHSFEDEISDIQRKTKIVGQDFVPLSIKLGEIRNTLNEVTDLIGRMSRIHNQFRPKRAFENEILLKSLKNLVAQLSEDLGKEAALNSDKFSGEDIPYQYRLLVKEILIQLIRNSISHGIEEPGTRIKAGKKSGGVIEIETSTDKNFFKLRLRDDGMGLRIKDLRKKVTDSGTWSQEKVHKWSEARVADCIFEQGISTSSEVNIVSGRGVGMDIIKQRIKSCRGQIRVTFSKGKYCEFIIILPLNDKENTES
jgi:ligand-binding sensor domain-containing protein/HPt (histidine-containing phosphotransfer) domain-containing protein